jgi:lipopolysaccharide export system permease protein
MNEPRGRLVRPPGDGGLSWGMDAKGETPVSWGILQRYVMGEVARAFVLALLTITAVFVLIVVMTQASDMGLTPQDIAKLVPFVIPSSLPYTIPVALLFAVTVVYGRMASDNEVVAVKTAGLSAWTVLWPSILLGLCLSGLLIYLTAGPIPRANHLAKQAIFKDLEEMFYKVLKKNRELDRPNWPFLIKVRDVEGRTLIDATFKRRAGKLRERKAPVAGTAEVLAAPEPAGPAGKAAEPAENPNTYDLVIQARKAIINFDLKQGITHVYLDGSESQINGSQPDVMILNDQHFEMPFPDNKGHNTIKKIQEWTTAELGSEQAKFRNLIAQERKRQAIAAALWIGSGRPQRVNWKQFQKAFTDYHYWEQKCYEYETEKQMRVALSFGSFFFVLLGAPVGVLFARRDFLSAFITCFLPIIILYYPLTLFGVNLGKEGLLNATVALWIGNSVLAVLAGFVWHPIMKH